MNKDIQKMIDRANEAIKNTEVVDFPKKAWENMIKDGTIDRIVAKRLGYFPNCPK